MTTSTTPSRGAEFYARHTRITNPGSMELAFQALPDTVPELVKVVQDLVLHVHWAGRYGVSPTEEQKKHVQARTVERILQVIMEIDPSPLTAARPLEKRFLGNCRDFSTLLCSMLRHKGIPSRARCGFGTYFLPEHFEDHWICEYWNGERWVRLDAQLDELQKKTLAIDFDTLDIPEGRFVNASAGWQKCRAGEADPAKFGIFEWSGLWFVRGNLIRELAALNEAEMLPWDVWGLIAGKDEELTEQDFVLLDRVARALVEDDEEVHSLYEAEPKLRVPESMIEAGM